MIRTSEPPHQEPAETLVMLLPWDPGELLHLIQTNPLFTHQLMAHSVLNDRILDMIPPAEPNT